MTENILKNVIAIHLMYVMCVINVMYLLSIHGTDWHLAIKHSTRFEQEHEDDNLLSYVHVSWPDYHMCIRLPVTSCVYMCNQLTQLNGDYIHMYGTASTETDSRCTCNTS